jgi:hypothetical protein
MKLWATFLVCMRSLAFIIVFCVRCRQFLCLVSIHLATAPLATASRIRCYFGTVIQCRMNIALGVKFWAPFPVRMLGLACMIVFCVRCRQCLCLVSIHLSTAPLVAVSRIRCYFGTVIQRSMGKNRSFDGELIPSGTLARVPKRALLFLHEAIRSTVKSWRTARRVRGLYLVVCLKRMRGPVWLGRLSVRSLCSIGHMRGSCISVQFSGDKETSICFVFCMSIHTSTLR